MPTTLLRWVLYRAYTRAGRGLGNLRIQPIAFLNPVITIVFETRDVSRSFTWKSLRRSHKAPPLRNVQIHLFQASSHITKSILTRQYNRNTQKRKCHSSQRPDSVWHHNLSFKVPDFYKFFILCYKLIYLSLVQNTQRVGLSRCLRGMWQTINI